MEKVELEYQMMFDSFVCMALGKFTSIQRGQLDRDLHSPKSMVMKYFSTFCKRGVRKCIRRTVTSVVVLLV